VSHFGLDANDKCLESILKRLPKMKQVFICRKQYEKDGHHDTEVAQHISHTMQHSPALSMTDMNQGKRIECRLPESLLHFILRQVVSPILTFIVIP
jgi:hypothetical protein